MIYKIGKAKLTIELGNIAEQNVDVIAFPANDKLWMSGRVAESIKKHFGDEIETDAMKQGPGAFGDIIVTVVQSGGKKHLLHTVIMGQDLVPLEDAIESGITNIFKKAESLGAKSIALSAMGGAMGKIPIETDAKIVVEKVIQSLLGANKLEDVRIILHNEGAFKAFTAELTEKFSKR
jgi:O-acetyl-ADP-ribose deacetylase (regulator of RNase III)